MVSHSFQSAELSHRIVVCVLQIPKNLHASTSSSRPPGLPQSSTRSPTSSSASPAPQESPTSPAPQASPASTAPQKTPTLPRSSSSWPASSRPQVSTPASPGSSSSSPVSSAPTTLRHELVGPNDRCPCQGSPPLTFNFPSYPVREFAPYPAHPN